MLAALALTASLAQAAPVDSIRIDVIVRDAKGRAVDNIKPGDFELREDGTPQTIAAVQLVRDAPRLVAIYLDEYYVSAAHTDRVKEALHRFIDEELRPEDQAVILRPLDSLLTIHLTRDHAELHRAIDAFQGRRGNYEPRTKFERDYLVTDRARADMQRAQSTWSTLNALTLQLANAGASRSSVLVVSEQADPVVRRRGFEGLPTSTSVTRAANRYNVSLYVFDPRDAVERAAAPEEGPNLLRVLTDDTDGALFGAESADAGLRQMIEDASSYYVLSYQSARYRDGAFHALDVRVKRPAVKARARRGFWAQTVDEIQRANLIAHARDPLPPLKYEPARHSSPLIRPWFGISRGESGKVRLTFVWEAAEPVPGERRVRIPARLETKVVGADGATAFEGTVSERTTTVFEVPPGRVTLTSSVEDGASRTIDSDIRDVLVKDLRGVVALGTPEVLRARTALDVRDLTQNPSAVPSSSREFSRAEHLLIRVPAYAPSQPPTLTAKLISPAKQPMRELTIQQASGARAFAQIDLPLASLAPGQYSVEIVATAPAGTAKDVLTFRVAD